MTTKNGKWQQPSRLTKTRIVEMIDRATVADLVRNLETTSRKQGHTLNI